MQSWRIIIPIFNFERDSFFEPIWYLADNVSCKIVADNDYGALWRFLDNDDNSQDKSLINPNTMCIYVSDISLTYNEKTIIEYARNQATIANSLFNLFSEEYPLVVSYAAILFIEKNEQFDTDERITVKNIVDLELVANMNYFRGQKYKLKTTANQERINQMYRLLSEVSNKYPQIYLTLSRFNSCLTRVSDRDRIIDITVCLESLIREKNELSFKFATYLSFISSKNVQERSETFDLLGSLYNARSCLVHGTSEERNALKDIQNVNSKWSIIVHLTKKAIIYYIFYLYMNILNSDRNAWKNHLKRLMLGIDGPIA